MVEMRKPVIVNTHCPQKPYILRLRSNVLREVVSYLSATEFLEFSITCKDFIKLINDKYVCTKIVLPKQLILLTQTLVDKVLDYRSICLLYESKYPCMNIEWKLVPIKYFHFCLYDSRKFVFLYQNLLVEIREINNFSNGLNSVYSKEFKEKIFYADGYKNKIVLLFRTKVEIIALNERTVFSTEIQEENVISFYDIPNKEWVKKVKIFNCGKNILLITKQAVHLLNDKMKLLRRHEIGSDKYRFLIPNVLGKNYLYYTIAELRIYKVGSALEKPITPDFHIDYIRTSHFSDAPQMIISDTIGELYHNKKKLHIRCLGKFKLINQYIIFSDYCNRAHIKIYDLVKNRELYCINNPSMAPFRNMFATPYKVIYEMEGRVFIENVVDHSRFDLMLAFEKLIQFKCFSNMVIVSGSCSGIYGVIILDMSRHMFFNDYQSGIAPPFELY